MGSHETKGGQVLVIDDEPISRTVLRKLLEGAGYQVATVADGQAGYEHIQTTPVDVVVSDLVMPDVDGLELLRRLAAVTNAPPVILISAHPSIDSAVLATKLGVYDYLEKPVDPQRLLHLTGRALKERRLFLENQQLQRQLSGGYGVHRILGDSPQIRSIRRLIEGLAASDVRVLILGPSGTGKELVAQAVHAVSGRRQRPFVAINCAGLPETLLESELFGHVRGAFTGADGARLGLVQAANTGTLFLDEIGDMTPGLQVRMLRLLEAGIIRQLGSNRETPVDVRVIAATHRNLARAVAEGHFREDLYYRINVFSLTMPALADRREDIPVLAQHFLTEASLQAKRAPSASARRHWTCYRRTAGPAMFGSYGTRSSGRLPLPPVP
jgi:DNA-binding NtrC family response regulator